MGSQVQKLHTKVPLGDTCTFCQGKSQISVRGSGSLRVTAAEGLRAAVLGGMGLAIIFGVDARSGTRIGAARLVLED